jgi:hypothetical protein
MENINITKDNLITDKQIDGGMYDVGAKTTTTMATVEEKNRQEMILADKVSSWMEQNHKNIDQMEEFFKHNDDDNSEGDESFSLCSSDGESFDWNVDEN